MTNPFDKFNQFKSGHAPQVLKGGVDGHGDFDMVCTRCGRKQRLNYKPEGVYARGIFTCTTCQEEIKAEGRAKEQSVFDRVLANNQDNIARQKKRLDEIGPGQSQVSPEKAKEMYEREIHRMEKQGRDVSKLRRY